MTLSTTRDRVRQPEEPSRSGGKATRAAVHPASRKSGKRSRRFAATTRLPKLVTILPQRNCPLHHDGFS
jgi:hypothetical protein